MQTSTWVNSPKGKELPELEKIAATAHLLVPGQLKGFGISQDEFRSTMDGLTLEKSNDPARGKFYLPREQQQNFNIDALNKEEAYRFKSLYNDILAALPDRSESDITFLAFVAAKYSMNLNLEEAGAEGCISGLCKILNLLMQGISLKELGQKYMYKPEEEKRAYYDSRFGKGAYDRVDAYVSRAFARMREELHRGANEGFQIPHGQPFIARAESERKKAESQRRVRDRLQKQMDEESRKGA